MGLPKFGKLASASSLDLEGMVTRRLHECIKARDELDACADLSRACVPEWLLEREVDDDLVAKRNEHMVTEAVTHIFDTSPSTDNGTILELMDLGESLKVEVS